MPGNSGYRQPQHLGPKHEPKHRLRCAIHGFIRYSDAERAIIDHAIFRRLRWIRQLALTELVYPGATHTRFEHSLGVMEMATRIFDRLAAQKGDLIERVLGQVEGLKDATLAKARQACRLAALLHDVGHCCFSHAAETVIHKEAGHEALTIELLKSDDHLKPELEKFFSGCSELTANLIKPAKEAPPQIRLLRDIISGEIDADRTDYLLRDSYHCGVDYGRFDHRRLIECLTVWQNEKSGELEMAIHRDGVHSFESLILARYQMNTQVYYHRLRRIYDRYLVEYFRALGGNLFDTPVKVLAWNDVRALQRLMEDADGQASPGKEWAERVIHRRHHRHVYSLDEKDGTLAVKRAKNALLRLQGAYPGVSFVDDFPAKQVTIHKVERPDDQEEDRVDFSLLENGRRTSLGERSQILNKLPGTFRIGMIFADEPDRTKRGVIIETFKSLVAQEN